MKSLVVTFVFLSVVIAAICFVGYFSIKAFCRPYPKKESSIWSDDLGADYEHEREIAKESTGYFNPLVQTFFHKYL
jgi:hypothetical protein